MKVPKPHKSSEHWEQKHRIYPHTQLRSRWYGTLVHEEDEIRTSPMGTYLSNLGRPSPRTRVDAIPPRPTRIPGPSVSGDRVQGLGGSGGSDPAIWAKKKAKTQFAGQKDFCATCGPGLQLGRMSEEGAASSEERRKGSDGRLHPDVPSCLFEPSCPG